MTVYFRTDANAEIATGHLMRCLSIAHACREKGMRTHFILSDEESLSHLNRITSGDSSLRPDAFTVLHSDYTKPLEEIDALMTFFSADMSESILPSAYTAEFDTKNFSEFDTENFSEPDAEDCDDADYAKKRAVLVLDTYYLDADYARRFKKTWDVMHISFGRNASPDAERSETAWQSSQDTHAPAFPLGGRCPEGADEGFSLAKIDDFGMPDFPADILINYRADAKEIHYTQADIVLAGLSYAPLRPAFAASASTSSATAANGDKGSGTLSDSGGDKGSGTLSDSSDGSLWQTAKSDSVPDPLSDAAADPEPVEGPLRILITAGGFDPYGMTQAVADALSELTAKADCSFTPVIADGSVRDMAALMRSCDLAVTAGGSTLIELCALGIPSVVFTTADNQLPQVRALMKQNAVRYAGSIGDATDAYVPQEKETVLSNIKTAVQALLADPEEYSRMSETMRGLVDGRGAQRIAAALANA